MGFGRELLISALSLAPAGAAATEQEDKRTVSQLDLDYQAAVKRNDAERMDQILHPKFALVLGNGRVVSREELLASAKAGTTRYEIQDEEPGSQTVRIWGDTAIVTALLRVKGVEGDKQFDRTLWFSDTYLKTEQGWKYAFAQASLPITTN